MGGHSTHREGGDPRIRFRPSALRHLGTRQLALRFAAGAGASLVAALVSEFAGAEASGPLLALPTILVASVTIVGREHGDAVAADDARGAAEGAVGMVAFALVAWLLLGAVPTAAALAVATAAWAGVSLLAHVVVRAVRRRRQRRRAPVNAPSG